jgi:thymidine phosphorylase
MKEIIQAQGGNPQISSNKLTLELGSRYYHIQALKRCIVKAIDSKHITIIARILGAPSQKGAGVYLDKKIGEIAEKGETLYTLYSENMYNLREAKESLKNFTIMRV